MNSRSLLIQLPTSFGKSKLGIDLALRDNPSGILIVIPRLVLIDSWKKEFIKWGFSHWLDKIHFSTYVGLNKHVKEEWDCIIFDEVHHLSERCRGFVSTMRIKQVICLSATVTEAMKWEIKRLFPGTQDYKLEMKKAIDDKVLPDPKVFLIPLELDNTELRHIAVVRPKVKNIKTCLYKDRWKYILNKSVQVHIHCTDFQWNLWMEDRIEYLKKSYMASRHEGAKTRWLSFAGQRLKCLSDLKTPFVLSLLNKLTAERTLTFCNSIEQTKVLGENCINSENKESFSILSKFNSGEIDHITACNMLNEGMNLVDCRIGIYANLNSSDIIIKQRLGRLLRHPDPVVIIPYFINTREEELVRKMIFDYNPELITKTSLDKIRI